MPNKQSPSRGLTVEREHTGYKEAPDDIFNSRLGIGIHEDPKATQFTSHVLSALRENDRIDTIAGLSDLKSFVKALPVSSWESPYKTRLLEGINREPYFSGAMSHAEDISIEFVSAEGIRVLVQTNFEIRTMCAQDKFKIVEAYSPDRYGWRAFNFHVFINGVQESFQVPKEVAQTSLQERVDGIYFRLVDMFEPR